MSDLIENRSHIDDLMTKWQYYRYHLYAQCTSSACKREKNQFRRKKTKYKFHMRMYIPMQAANAHDSTQKCLAFCFVLFLTQLGALCKAQLLVQIAQNFGYHLCRFS